MLLWLELEAAWEDTNNVKHLLVSRVAFWLCWEPPTRS